MRATIMNRYHLETSGLRAELFVEGEARELVNFINEEQALRVVPVTRSACGVKKLDRVARWDS
jgi:hypothetical protein